MDLVGRPPGPQAHQRVDAAGVVADHPAEGVVRVRRGVGGEGQVVLLGLGAEDVEHRPGLHPRQLRRGVDREDLVEVLRPVHHDGDVAAAAGQARAAAPRQERCTVAAADGDGRDHVVDVLGDDDADRHLAVVRAVGGVERAAAGVEPDLAADRLAQLGRERRGVDEEGPGDLLAVPLVVVVAVAMVIGVVLSFVASVLQTANRAASCRLNSRPRPGRDRSGRSAPSDRRQRAVEEHVLDPVVVVEILEVAEARQGAGRVGVERGAQWADSGRPSGLRTAPRRAGSR